MGKKKSVQAYRPTCGEAENLGRLQLYRVNQKKGFIGSCNFCSSMENAAWELMGGAVSVRFCDDCMNELVKQQQE